MRQGTPTAHAGRGRPWAVLAVAGLVFCAVDPRSAAARANRIVPENRRPGTAAWQITRPAMEREIEGYADRASAVRGDRIRFFVNTPASSYWFQIFRMGWYGGLGGRAVTRQRLYPIAGHPLPVQPPCTAPTNDPATSVVECDWQDPIVVRVRGGWRSGVYVAKLTALGDGPEVGRESYVPFVVRADSDPSSYLVVLPVTTYQAYNNWGGQSLYTYNTACHVDCTFGCRCADPSVAASSIVSFDRPYGPYVADDFVRSGASGYPTNPWNGRPINPDNSIGAGLLFDFDLNMIRWLEREGYDVSYATNLDVDADPTSLLLHRAVVSIGHDEYWSTEMLCTAIAARDAGVSFGFLGENTAFKHVVFEPSASGQLRRRMRNVSPSLDAAPVACDGSGATYNRSALVGLYFAYFPVEAPMVVASTTSATGLWLFQGTGLRDGDRLAGLVGYEMEVAAFPAGDSQHLDYTLLALSSPTFNGVGPECQPSTTQACAAAIAYRAPSGARVVSLGSMFWPWGLDAYSANPPGLPTGVLALDLTPGFSFDKASRLDPRVAQITMNVLEHLAPTAAPRCGDASFDVRVEPVADASGPAWPGGITTVSASPGCAVTVARPSGVVGDASTAPVAGFAIDHAYGFARCIGVGGATRDGCAVECDSATPDSCAAPRSSCGAITAATYHVECHDH